MIGLKYDLNKLVEFGIGDALTRAFGITIIKFVNISQMNYSQQAYLHKNYEMVGLYYQKSLFIGLFLCVFLTPIFYFSDKIMYLMNIEESLAKHASEYVWVFLPGLYAYTFFDCTKCYLFAQQIYYPAIYIQML